MLSSGTRFAFSLSHGYEEGASVLKITRLLPRERGLTIKLEGELLEPWVSSVRDACAVRGRRPRHLRLDLAAVSYVDTAGIQLLRDLVAEGAEINACSSFVGALLLWEP
jgi:anti-anti-sigma regulatory factor